MSYTGARKSKGGGPKDRLPAPRKRGVDNMKFKVNETCIGCGLCEGTCPAVFHMTDAGQAEAIPDVVPQEEEANAVAAMEGCPVGAIEKVEE